MAEIPVHNGDAVAIWLSKPAVGRGETPLVTKPSDKPTEPADASSAVGRFAKLKRALKSSAIWLSKPVVGRGEMPPVTKPSRSDELPEEVSDKSKDDKPTEPGDASCAVGRLAKWIKDLVKRPKDLVKPTKALVKRPKAPKLPYDLLRLVDLPRLVEKSISEIAKSIRELRIRKMDSEDLQRGLIAEDRKESRRFIFRLVVVAAAFLLALAAMSIFSENAILDLIAWLAALGAGFVLGYGWGTRRRS